MNKVLNSVKEYFAEFKILKKTPPEFWNLNLVINFFEMLAYFMFITVISLYLTENIGLDDEWSQNLVGLFTTLITIIIFFSGVFIDWLGIKAALFLSMAILIPGRFLLGFTVPLEEHLITNKLEDPAVQEMALTRIAERELDKRYFTQDALKLRAAQLDWLMQDEEIVKSGVTKTDLENDMANRMAKLTEGFTRDQTKLAKRLERWGDLDQEYPKLLSFLLKQDKELKEKYLIDPDPIGMRRNEANRVLAAFKLVYYENIKDSQDTVKAILDQGLDKKACEDKTAWQDKDCEKEPEQEQRHCREMKKGLQTACVANFAEMSKVFDIDHATEWETKRANTTKIVAAFPELTEEFGADGQFKATFGLTSSLDDAVAKIRKKHYGDLAFMQDPARALDAQKDILNHYRKVANVQPSPAPTEPATAEQVLPTEGQAVPEAPIQPSIEQPAQPSAEQPAQVAEGAAPVPDGAQDIVQALEEAQVAPPLPTVDDIAKDPKVLKAAVLALFADQPDFAQKAVDAFFDEKLITAILTEETPVLAERYFTHLENFKGKPAELKEQLVSIIMAYPQLRAELGEQTIIIGWVVVMLIIIGFGEALMVPAIYAAIRKYTNKRTSGTAFNFQYLTMNIAAVSSGIFLQYLRDYFGNDSILTVGGVLAVLCTVAVLFLRGNIEVDDNDQVVEMPAKTKDNRENPGAIILSVIRESAFWRFMFFLIILIGVRLVFTHQFLVMPKYYVRMMGPDAPIGFLNAINPAIIVVGLIIMIPILMRFSVFKLIVLGTFISASSLLFLVIPGIWLADFLGTTVEQAYLYTIFLQIVVFAVGELIWSPRLSEYTVTIAPKGREGTYMSLAALPMFLAKPLNGWLSGKFLTWYCPDGALNEMLRGERDFWHSPEFMWLIYALIAVSSPILVILLKNVIRTDNQDEKAASEGNTPEANEDETKETA